VVLGLVFLKYISESFNELYDKLKAEKWSDPEDRDEYIAENTTPLPTFKAPYNNFLLDYTPQLLTQSLNTRPRCSKSSNISKLTP
jgi:hypothetical protein